jgi:hypothetical protein
VDAVDRDAVVVREDFAGEPPVDRVVLEQLRECRRGDEIVDRHHFYVCILFVRGAQEATADPAKSVNRYTYGH